jgi:hypothetical protein
MAQAPRRVGVTARTEVVNHLDANGHAGTSFLCSGRHPGTIRAVESLVSREEVTATLFAIADINANVEHIVELLEGGENGEEGFTEAES